MAAPDGTRLWVHTVGPEKAPRVISLHGGPGFNSFTFEKAIGPRLAQSLRMVYLDQRGCGRSSDPPDPEGFNLSLMVDDIEVVRRASGRDKIGVIGHSFGGVLAVMYAQRYPEHVSGVVLVDTTTDLPAAFDYQIQRAAVAFPEQAPTLQAILDSESSPIEKLDQVYGLLGRVPLQRELMFTNDESLAMMDGWDRDSRLQKAHDGSLPRKLRADGMRDSSFPELGQPIQVPAVLFAGRLSHGIGPENMEAAAARWKIPLVWFENSGHFIYLDEPDQCALN